EKLVLNGVSLESEPILRIVREIEADIKKQARERQRGVPQMGAGGSDVNVEQNMDLLTAGELTSADIGGAFRRTRINYEGAGGGSVDVTQLSPWGHAGGFFLKKTSNGVPTGESGTYEASLERTVGSGRVAEMSRTLAGFQRSRAVSFGADPGEAALLGSLQHEFEPRRNPGTRVLNVLLSDQFAAVPDADNRKREVRDFIRTFRRQTMAPAGSSAAATALRPYLSKPSGSLDRQIDKHVAKLRNMGVPEGMLSGNLRDNPTVARWMALAREERNKQQRDRKAAKARGQAYRPPPAKWDNRRLRSLERLQKMQDANELANREIALIKSWILSRGALDVADRGDEEKVRRSVIDRIVGRLRQEFPWWTPGKEW
ncbi:MAG TPA: hypothetical protein VEK09_10830, partial [Jatrophihabitantaceae bacterium]|nr:hypothetical protein [Jatrophihabitantaceae bacterium]